MSNITEPEIKNLEDILLCLGKAHNMLAKTSLSKEEYQPISNLLASAKVELFNFYNDHKAALQNKVSDEDIIKEAKRLWKIPNKLEAVKLVTRLGYSLKHAKAYCEDNFDRKVSDINAEEVLFNHIVSFKKIEDKNDEYFFPYKSSDEMVKQESICKVFIGAMQEYASIVNERKDNIGVNLIKWIRENWIVGANDLWRRQKDMRDQRTDQNLYEEYLFSEEEESEKELEERTERNMDVISDFCEHVKNEVGLVIPESTILSFFNA